MLAELCTVLLSVVGVTTDVLAETIIAVAEVIRGNYANQEYFAGRTLGSSLGNRFFSFFICQIFCFGFFRLLRCRM